MHAFLLVLCTFPAFRLVSAPGSEFEGLTCRDQGYGRYTIHFSRPEWVNVRLKNGVTLARFAPSPVHLTTPNWSRSGPREFTVESPLGNTITVRSRTIFLEGARNFRDLGGYPAADGKSVVWGQLFRSDSLDHITDADLSILTHLGLSEVVDFRTPMEKTASIKNVPTQTEVPLPIPADGKGPNMAALLNLLKGTPTSAAAEGFMVSTYQELPQAGASAFRGLFDLLKSSKGPLLMHCTAGKDRTGLATALVLTVLGVPRSVIFDDYMESNALYADSPAARQQLMGLLRMVSGGPGEKSVSETALLPIFRVERRCLDAAFASIDQTPGGWVEYRRRVLGVSDADQLALRRRFLK